MSELIKVNMLGTFSIEYNGLSVDDQSNRMRKIWLLLAYMIYSRNSRITQDAYFSLLQSSAAEDSADPNGRLKAMFYRARNLLEQLGEGLGHTWIIRKSGSYAWNTEIPLQLDVEEFDRLCSGIAAIEDEQQRLARCLQALSMYQGDFLSKLSMESWVMPISAYYHQMYLSTADHALSLLEARALWSDAAELCRKALKIEPYSEELYQHLMRSLIALNDNAGAQCAYEEMSELLFSTFGVMPSDESRRLYRNASRSAETPCVPVDSVRDHLKEPAGASGALYCEYDFFKLLYQVQARAIIRSGDTIHIALFSCHGHGNKDLPRRSLDRAMDNLQDLIVSSLRQGDVVTRCSVSQMIVMLPQANYENSCAVCQRVLKNFARQYPHSPVDIHYSVQPLEPLTGVPHTEH